MQFWNDPVHRICEPPFRPVSHSGWTLYQGGRSLSREKLNVRGMGQFQTRIDLVKKACCVKKDTGARRASRETTKR
jgi:hypothetical protein